jgi:hypothetical protein
MCEPSCEGHAFIEALLKRPKRAHEPVIPGMMLAAKRLPRLEPQAIGNSRAQFIS